MLPSHSRRHASSCSPVPSELDGMSFESSFQAREEHQDRHCASHVCKGSWSENRSTSRWNIASSGRRIRRSGRSRWCYGGGGLLCLNHLRCTTNLCMKRSICFSLSLYPFADCILSSRDLQLRVWVLVALGTFVDAILLSSRNDGVVSFVVKMKPKRVSTDMVIRRANYSRDQGVGQEPRFRRCLESNAICMGRPETPIDSLIANVTSDC
jgi:hypothetical protein